MDIPNAMNLLPLEDRLEAVKAIRFLFKSGLFESIAGDLRTEVLQAAMVLAHNCEYAQMERSSIRMAAITELFDGLKQTLTQKEN